MSEAAPLYVETHAVSSELPTVPFAPTELDAPESRPRAKSTPPAGRPIPRVKQRQARRLKIIEGAAPVLARHGQRASVSQVMASAGVSRSTFYRYFSNIDDVLLAVRAHAANLFATAVEDAASRGSSVPRRLRAVIDAYIGAVTANADFARVLYREPSQGGSTTESSREVMTGRFVRLLQVNLHEATAAGLAVASPDAVMLRAIVYGIEGVALEHLEKNRESRLASAAPTLFELVSRTLRA